MATRSIGEYMTHGIRGTGIDPTVMAGMTHGIRGAGDGESIRHGTMAGTTHVGRGAGVILTMHGMVTVLCCLVTALVLSYATGFVAVV